MDRFGAFTVSDDPDGAVALGLSIALAPQHGESWRTALLPDGDGLELYSFGQVARARSRDDLPMWFSQDESIDVAAREVWFIDGDSTDRHPSGQHALLEGQELRALVAEASEMRRRGRDQP